MKAKIFLSSLLLIGVLACTPTKINTCPIIPIPAVEELPAVKTPSRIEGKYCFTEEDVIYLKRGIDQLKNRINTLEKEITTYNTWQHNQEK